MNDVQVILAGLMHNPCPPLGRWVKHNCPVCLNGSSGRVRGSYIFESDSFAYHCFNCSFKTGWKPGYTAHKKLLEFAEKSGANANDIIQLQMIAKEIIEKGDFEKPELTNSSIYQKITQRQLPSTAKTFLQWAEEKTIPKGFLTVLELVYETRPYLLDLELYWSPDKNNDINYRYILPYYVNGEIVGWTGRDIRKYTKLKYFNQIGTNTFYNFDLLNDPNAKVLLVTEGVFDAALMGGLGTNSFRMSDNQIQQLKQAKSRGKRIIVVPDRDKEGLETIKQALECGFEVSLPDWGTKRTPDGVKFIKDFEEATRTYGRLFCSLLIHKSVCASEFETKVLMNKWI